MHPYIAVPPLYYIFRIFYVWIEAIISRLRGSASKRDVDTIETKDTTPYRPPTISSLSDQYIERQLSLFRRTYTTDDPRLNENIDPVFYNKSEWTEVLRDEHNFLEKKWRTKILYESTPRGNIVMYYDAFKLGFVYFSDQNMPYSVLNAVSMKYVLTFCCRDFFMDEVVLTDLSPSGIMSKHKEDAEQEKTNKDAEKGPAHRNEFSVANAKSPFAKFKSYNNVSAKIKSNALSTEYAKASASANAKANVNAKVNLDEDKQLNRFIHLGKICNTSFLQKYKIPLRINIPRIEGAITDNNLYSIFGETPEQRDTLSYEDTETLQGVSSKVNVPIAKLTYAEYKKLLCNNK
jgi:hypothetical protein